MPTFHVLLPSQISAEEPDTIEHGGTTVSRAMTSEEKWNESSDSDVRLGSDDLACSHVFCRRST